MKTIYLEPEEEIISVIDRLTQTKSQRVSLVVPTGAQIWQNPINLKLLKRESDNLGKEITLFVPDELKAEVAEKIGFSVKRGKNRPIVELIREEKEKSISKGSRPIQSEPAEDMIGLLIEELKPDEREREVDYLSSEKYTETPSTSQDASLISEKNDGRKEKKFSWFGSRESQPQKKMVDIVRPGGRNDFFQPSRSKPESDEPAPKRFFPKPFSKEKIPQRSPRLKIERAEPVIREKVWRGDKDFETITRPSRWPKFLAFFIILSFLTAGLVAYLALPTAEIEINLKKEKISFDLAAVGSKNISRVDQSLNEIPLEEIKVEKTKSKEFPATGEKELDERAGGRITIYNEYSSSPQTLIGHPTDERYQTRFESPQGKIFRILKTVTVPGAKIEEGKIVPSSIEVTVIADQPGDSYNIGPTNFTIPGFQGTPKYAGFYAKSDSPMSGGYIGLAKVVSAEDLEKAKKSLTEELKNEVRQTLQEQVPTDLKLVEEGTKETITKILTVKEETMADSFNVEISVSVQALFFRENDLKELIDLNLISQIEGNKTLLPETQQINYKKISIDWQKSEVNFDLRIDEEVVWQIDLIKLKQDLAGQTEESIKRYLANQPEIETVKVTFRPFWVKRIPFQEKKIELTID